MYDSKCYLQLQRVNNNILNNYCSYNIALCQRSVNAYTALLSANSRTKAQTYHQHVVVQYHTTWLTAWKRLCRCKYHGIPVGWWPPLSTSGVAALDGRNKRRFRVENPVFTLLTTRFSHVRCPPT